MKEIYQMDDAPLTPGFVTKPDSHPLVSLIIPFYKQEAYLAEAVRSGLLQNPRPFEIVVVDDGSPVSAASLLHEFEGITIIRTSNQGSSAARNTGAEHSSGQYLIFLDADDRLFPGAIAAHLKTLEPHPEYALSFGAVRLINGHGLEIRPAHLCRPRKNYFTMLLGSNPIACPGGAMIRRAPFFEAGLFDPVSNLAEDYWLYLRIAHRHQIARTPQCVVEYRSHPHSASQNQERLLAATLATLDRLETTFELSASERQNVNYGRRRWTHNFRPQHDLSYNLRTMYYSFRALLDVIFFK